MSRHRTPPLNTLRAFEVAARHGSFAKAADELNVTAAAISHRIKGLETALEIDLFERMPRGVTLTDVGRRYRDKIASALQTIEVATRDIELRTVDGPLTVSMPQSLAEHWLVPRLNRLKARFPGLELTIEGSSRLLGLHDGQADMSIRFGTGTYPGLDSLYLCGDAVTVLAPFDTAQEMTDIRAKSLLRDATLLVDNGATTAEAWNAWSPWLREAGMRGGHNNHKIRFSDSSIMTSACRDSVGLCIGRMSFAFEHVRRRELHVLFPWRSTAFAHHLVTRRADRENPRMIAFRAWLVEEIKNYVNDVWNTLGVELA